MKTSTFLKIENWFVVIFMILLIILITALIYFIFLEVKHIMSFPIETITNTEIQIEKEIIKAKCEIDVAIKEFRKDNDIRSLNFTGIWGDELNKKQWFVRYGTKAYVNENIVEVEIEKYFESMVELTKYLIDNK